MHKCAKCGSQVKTGVKYCRKCGTLVVSIQPEYIAKIEILKKKIEKDSLNPNLYIELGSFYQQGNLLQEALVEFQKAVNIDDSALDAHLKSGNTYLELKDYAKAIVSFQKALDIAQDSIAIKNALFNAFYLHDKMEQALELGEEIVEIEPNNLGVHRALKEFYVNKELKDKALNSLETILSLAPDDKIALRELATLYVENDENDKALNCHNRILELDPSDSEGLFFKGKYYLTKGDYEKAIEYLSNVAEELQFELKASAHLYLTYAYINLKDMVSSKREFARILFEDTKKLSDKEREIIVEINIILGDDCEEQRQWKNAITHYYNVLKIMSEFPDCRDQIDNVSKKIKEIENTIKSVSRKKSILLLATTAVVMIAAISFYFIWDSSHGTFSINTMPNSSIHYLSGKLEGTIVKLNDGFFVSPSLPSGEIEIQVSKSGFKNFTKVIIIEGGKAVEIQAKQDTLYFTLNVTTDPSGAEVYLDGGFIGNSPVMVDNIWAIHHSLKISKKHYGSFKSSLKHFSGDTLRVENVKLKNVSGIWSFVFKGNEIKMTVNQRGIKLACRFEEKHQGRLKTENYNGTLTEYNKILINHPGNTAMPILRLLEGNIKGIIDEGWDVIQFEPAGIYYSENKSEWPITAKRIK